MEVLQHKKRRKVNYNNNDMLSNNNFSSVLLKYCLQHTNNNAGNPNQVRF